MSELLTNVFLIYFQSFTRKKTIQYCGCIIRRRSVLKSKRFQNCHIQKFPFNRKSPANIKIWFPYNRVAHKSILFTRTETLLFLFWFCLLWSTPKKVTPEKQQNMLNVMNINRDNIETGKAEDTKD